jgi:hypothetical protein
MRSLLAIAAVRSVLRSGCGADLMRRCLQYTLYWRDLRSLHQQWCGYSCSPQSSEDKTLNLKRLIAEHARKEGVRSLHELLENTFARPSLLAVYPWLDTLSPTLSRVGILS